MYVTPTASDAALFEASEEGRQQAVYAAQVADLHELFQEQLLQADKAAAQRLADSPCNSGWASSGMASGGTPTRVQPETPVADMQVSPQGPLRQPAPAPVAAPLVRPPGLS